METIVGDVAYLSAPNVRMSVVVPCTVIYKNDAAEQLLDRDQNPEWHGKKFPFFTSMPHNMELWNQYYDLKTKLMRRDQPVDEANKFYKTHQAAMDDGAAVTWEARKGGALTSIQHGMDRFLANRSAFNAEFQNQPDSNQEGSVDLVEPYVIVRRFAHTKQHTVPKYAEEVVAHIDVQQESLWYAIAAGSRRFEVCIPDYGIFPDQGREYYTKRDILSTLSRRYPDEKKMDTRIYLAIRELVDDLAKRVFVREDGTRMQISKILVDCGYEQSLVIKSCRESEHSVLVTPSKGISITATQKQFAEYRRKEGETLGHHWIQKPIKGDMIVMMDVNYWKAQVHQMLRANPGPGALYLFRDHLDRHRVFADHLNSENCVRVTAKGSTVEEWFPNPGNPDNEYFDNMVGCLVALSMRGCQIPGLHEGVVSDPEKRVVQVKVLQQSQNRYRRRQQAREGENGGLGPYMG
jgi:hypothetical protein